MTFICSKTDDISLEEAQDSLGLDDEMAPDWAELDQLVKKQKSIEKRLEDLKDSKTVYGEVMNDVDEQIEVWVRQLSVIHVPLDHSAISKASWLARYACRKSSTD